jgi:ubiquitin carboxyl-terminal hydrolase 14
MNSSLQCLYAVEPLRKALLEWKPAAAADSQSKLAVETRDLFKDLSSGGEAFPPFRFLLNMRNQFPQFSQQGNDGVYMQQDAEECYSGLLYTLRERLKVGRTPHSTARRALSVCWVAAMQAVGLPAVQSRLRTSQSASGLKNTHL